MKWQYAETKVVRNTFNTSASATITSFTATADETFIVKAFQVSNNSGDRTYDGAYFLDNNGLACQFNAQTASINMLVPPDEIPGGIKIGPGQSIRLTTGSGGTTDGVGQINMLVDKWVLVP